MDHSAEPAQHAAQWRSMAERVRELVDSIGHPLAQDNLLHLAREWERIANRIERQKPVVS
jgi:hypothetical protein